MNLTQLDKIILLLVKLVGSGVLLLGLLVVFSLLAWGLYKQLVGWTHISAALKHYRCSSPKSGVAQDSNEI